MTTPTNEEWGISPADWAPEPRLPVIENRAEFVALVVLEVSRRNLAKCRRRMLKAQARLGRALTDAFVASDKLDEATDLTLLALSDVVRARRPA